MPQSGFRNNLHWQGRLGGWRDSNPTPGRVLRYGLFSPYGPPFDKVCHLHQVRTPSVGEEEARKQRRIPNELDEGSGTTLYGESSGATAPHKISLDRQFATGKPTILSLLQTIINIPPVSIFPSHSS